MTTHQLPLGYRLLSALRHLPQFRGKWRLASRFARRLGDTSPSVVVPGAGNVRLAFPSLKEPIAFGWLIDGPYEPDTVRFLAAALRLGGTLLDVGANVGALAVPMARKLGANGSVICVEASARVFPYLRDNLTRNAIQNAFAVHAVASSVAAGEATFYDAPDGAFGMGGRTHYPGYSETRVPSVRVDDLLRSFGRRGPLVIKVDVEGYELDVLRGAEETLRSVSPPVVVFEFNDWSEANAGFAPGAAQAFLIGLGYRLSSLADALGRRQPTLDIRRSGSEMLVATRADTHPSLPPDK